MGWHNWWFTVGLRTIEAALEASPTLLVGVLFAAALRSLVAPERTRAWFGGSGWTGLLRTSMLASLTPICSIGVLPLVRELDRAGIPRTNSILFLIAAPILNPITLVFGLTILSVPNFFLLLVGILFLSSLVALGMGRILPNNFAREVVEDRAAGGTTRLADFGVQACRLACGWLVVEMILAFIVSGINAASVPAEFFAELGYLKPWAGVEATPAVFLAFISPATGVMQFGSFASVQGSLAAGFVLLVLGIGFSAPTLWYLVRTIHWRSTVALLLILTAGSLAIGGTANAVLPHPRGTEDDSHALDPLTQLYWTGDTRAEFRSLWAYACRDRDLTTPLVAWGVLGLAAGVGMVLRLAGVDKVRWHSPHEAGFWDRPLPPRVRAGVGVAGVLVLMGLLLYVYFPPPSELVQDIDVVRTGAVTAVRLNDRELAESELRTWIHMLKKTPHAAWLYGSPLADEDLRRLNHLLSRLEETQGRMSDGLPEEARSRLAIELDDEYRALRSTLARTEMLGSR